MNSKASFISFSFSFILLIFSSKVLIRSSFLPDLYTAVEPNPIPVTAVTKSAKTLTITKGAIRFLLPNGNGLDLSCIAQNLSNGK